MSLEQAEARIQQCLATKSPSLDLAKLRLFELPESIGQLHHVTKVDCSNNYLQDLGALNKLKQLEALHCAHNKLSDLRIVTGLENLRSLNCSSNRLEDLTYISCLQQLVELKCARNRLEHLEFICELPNLAKCRLGGNLNHEFSFVEQLTNLQEFGCSGSQLSDIGFVEALTQLTSLDCSSNPLTDIDVVKELKQLTSLWCARNKLTDINVLKELKQLRSLDCSASQLTDINVVKELSKLELLQCSLNSIRDAELVKEVLNRNKRLKHVNFSGNPIFGVPQEILSSLDQLRTYFKDIEQGEIENKNIKLLILGNGLVGKSTLAYGLQNGVAPDKYVNIESTHGILLNEIVMEADRGDPWNIQLWDFGGQEIYHATHRLFYSSNALYLVLWAEETEESPDEQQYELTYWLDMLQMQAKDCKIILVKNQINRSNKLGLHLPELAIAPYNALPHYGISANTYERVDTVKTEIKECLKALAKNLPKLPVSWAKVREELEQEQERRPFIAKTELGAALF